MKKIFGYIALCAGLLAFATSLQAQERLQMRVGYNAGFPVGAFKDFMGKNSFRGYFGDITYAITEQFKVGLGVQNNDYYEKFPRQIFETKDGTISAVLTNSIQTTPILAKATYELTKTSWLRPYVGLGAGINVIGYRQFLGEYPQSKSSVKPAASAEAGFTLPFNKITRASGISAGLHYNYMPYNFNEVKNLNNWGFQVGLFFPLG